MVDVRKYCGAAVLIGVSNGAATLNFLTDEFKKLSILSLSWAFQKVCLVAIPTCPTPQDCGPTMCSLFPTCDPHEPSCTPYPPPPSPRQPLLPPRHPLCRPTTPSVPRSSPNFEPSVPPAEKYSLTAVLCPQYVARVRFPTSSTQSVLRISILSRSKQL
jgi:hypothetical protein